MFCVTAHVHHPSRIAPDRARATSTSPTAKHSVRRHPDPHSRLLRLQRELDQLTREREQTEQRVLRIASERAALEQQNGALARENEALKMQMDKLQCVADQHALHRAAAEAETSPDQPASGGPGGPKADRRPRAATPGKPGGTHRRAVAANDMANYEPPPPTKRHDKT